MILGHCHLIADVLQIEAGEGTETAIQQLKQENASITAEVGTKLGPHKWLASIQETCKITCCTFLKCSQSTLSVVTILLGFAQSSLNEKISTVQQTLETQASEHQEKVNDLYRQLQEAKAQLQTSQDTGEKLEKELREAGEKLQDAQQKAGILEAELKTKVCEQSADICALELQRLMSSVFVLFFQVIIMIFEF